MYSQVKVVMYLNQNVVASYKKNAADTEHSCFVLFFLSVFKHWFIRLVNSNRMGPGHPKTGFRNLMIQFTSDPD